MEVDRVLARSMARIVERMPAESPLVEDGRVCCPWCVAPMVVRRTKIDSSPADHVVVDNVYLKHAGDGCCFLPNFHVPLDDETYERELELRGDDLLVYNAESRSDEEAVAEHLRALGYL